MGGSATSQRSVTCTQATKLRLAGNSEARMGNLQKAADLYSQGLALNPPNCRHLLLSNRSGVLLSLGQAQAAVEDAQEAVRIAPPGFHTAVIRQVSRPPLFAALPNSCCG